MLLEQKTYLNLIIKIESLIEKADGCKNNSENSSIINKH